MIIPDANLLLYSYDSQSPFHEKSACWWRGLHAEGKPIGLCAVVIFAFVRLATNPKVFERPLTIDQTEQIIGTWFDQPNVQFLPQSQEDITVALGLLRASGASGNLTSDAQIAALALRYRATIHTADLDFKRLQGVKSWNPILES